MMAAYMSASLSHRQSQPTPQFITRLSLILFKFHNNNGAREVKAADILRRHRLLCCGAGIRNCLLHSSLRPQPKDSDSSAKQYHQSDLSSLHEHHIQRIQPSCVRRLHSDLVLNDCEEALSDCIFALVLVPELGHLNFKTGTPVL